MSEERKQLAELARQARAWVEWVADSGVDELPTQGDPRQLLARLEADGGSAQPDRSAESQRGAQPQRSAQPQRKPPPRYEPPAQPRAAAAAPAAQATPVATAQEPTLSPDEKRQRLQQLEEQVKSCTRCDLHRTRTNTAFSRGSSDAELVFVGEGPGAEEDRQGLPFVGKAGQLLDQMIKAMGYERDEVYICNIVKCRPPKNRKPEQDEIAACTPYLREQLELLGPKAMVALGATGVQGLLGTTIGITRMRGRWKLYKGRIPLMPTFHPAYLLRSPDKKRAVWDDLKQVMQRLGKPIPSRSGDKTTG